MIKLEVSTHSGDTLEVEADEFDVVEFTELRNGNVEAIALGAHSLSRIDIKNVKVIANEVVEDEQGDEQTDAE